MTFKEFILALINPNDNRVSSKTVIGLFSFLYAFVAGIANLFWDYKPSDYVFFGILGLAAAAFGLNTIISTKKLDTEKTPDVTVGKANTVNVEAKKAFEGPAQPAPADSQLAENEIIG